MQESLGETDGATGTQIIDKSREYRDVKNNFSFSPLSYAVFSRLFGNLLFCLQCFSFVCLAISDLFFGSFVFSVFSIELVKQQAM